jgi:AraC-like DNA-binding protein
MYMEPFHPFGRIPPLTEWREHILRAQFSPGRLAAAFGCTPYALRKFCRAQAGCTTRQLLQQQRLLAAEIYLLRGCTVATVIRRLGYRDYSHFNAHFKRTHGGLTGTTWRNCQHVPNVTFPAPAQAG